MTGRPPIEFDLDELEKLGELHCTLAEVAAFFDCSEDTITRRMKDDEAFAERYKRGKEGGKRSLRRLQWTSAEGGNVTMQIFLGKNLLGQTDDTKLRELEARLNQLEKNGSGT